MSKLKRMFNKNRYKTDLFEVGWIYIKDIK